MLYILYKYAHIYMPCEHACLHSQTHLDTYTHPQNIVIMNNYMFTHWAHIYICVHMCHAYIVCARMHMPRIYPTHICTDKSASLYTHTYVVHICAHIPNHAHMCVHAQYMFVHVSQAVMNWHTRTQTTLDRFMGRATPAPSTPQYQRDVSVMGWGTLSQVPQQEF